MTTQTVLTSSGRAIAYEKTGQGDPLVIVHQAFADHTSWLRVIPLLAETYTIYAVDRLGHGDSAPYPPDARMEDEYEALTAVLDSIAAPVNLLGHSAGARVALHAAAQNPTHIAKLILYEPPEFHPLLPDLQQQLYAAHVAGNREESVKLAVIDYVGGATGEQPPLSVLKQSPLWPTLVRNAPSIYPEIMAYTTYTLPGDRFTAFPVPTTFFVGTRSPMFLHNATAELRHMLPSSTLIELGGQGHQAQLSAPELLAHEVQRFLTSH